MTSCSVKRLTRTFSTFQNVNLPGKLAQRQPCFNRNLPRHFPRCPQINIICNRLQSNSAQQSSDEEKPAFAGINDCEWTYKLDLIAPTWAKRIPVYRVLGIDGDVKDESQVPNLSEDQIVSMYKTMVTINQMDRVLYDSQRQGRISFYMTSYGEEATHVGSAAALDINDVIYAQYREVGVLLWRGFSLESAMNQCFGNSRDPGKGKQMPVHYGAPELNFVTISSTLATQMPQAAGHAYALKQKTPGRVVTCYFGEGTTSEGDAHAAFNFASTLKCPVIFFCRNNGYAISTPTRDQYAGDGIASRGIGYGMPVIRVDGNDIFAVYNATEAAKRTCVAESTPVLIEAMTYRVGHHSTSDDWTAYRSTEEVSYWTEVDHPIYRLRKYMDSRGIWDNAKEEEYIKGLRKQIMQAFRKAEAFKKPDPLEVLSDVYSEMTPALKEEKEKLRQHLKTYGDKYNLKDYEAVGSGDS
ncbi:2-oxoisovalerate dehydrogenase subunit alpha, mitochondrial-like isoform X2 [Convolutriloba macropyga]|uniref:2-oxoisovalerate dehydrogenase subunit alpha, mitochondrial-like isoform X2 n=1 Tax=Convolutriloba macropyga TaxID=536237 RepID=UPI003F5202BD